MRGIRCCDQIGAPGLEDLLFGADSGKARPPAGAPKLMLIDDKMHGCVCNNLSEWEFDDPATVMRLLDVGEKRAKVSATKVSQVGECASLQPLQHRCTAAPPFPTPKPPKYIIYNI